MRTRIKICGLTRLQDVEAAIDAGVDALGFVFYAASPRSLDAARARELIRRMPAWMASVGLFVNAPRDEILRTADVVGLSHLQLHGDETPEDCQGLGRPVIKALRIRSVSDEPSLQAERKRIHGLFSDYGACQAVLLDADSAGFGGSGQPFNWEVLAGGLPGDPLIQRAWVLSGGLESGSVAEAIDRLSPPCVDVSSGVERMIGSVVQKGQKDPQRIKEFVQSVRRADQRRTTLS